MKRTIVFGLLLAVILAWAPEVMGVYIGATKFIGVEDEKMVFDMCERTRGWSTNVAAINFATTTQHIQGELAFTYDKTNGDVAAAIEKTIGRYKINAVDCNVVAQLYLSALTDVKEVTLHLGSSTNHYTGFLISDYALKVGWQEISFPMVTPNTQVGDGMDTDAISWLRFRVVFDNATDVLTDIRVDEWTWSYVGVFDSNDMLQTVTIVTTTNTTTLVATPGLRKYIRPLFLSISVADDAPGYNDVTVNLGTADFGRWYIEEKRELATPFTMAGRPGGQNQAMTCKATTTNRIYVTVHYYVGRR